MPKPISLFTPGPAPDLAYKNIRDIDRAIHSDIRQFVDDLWARYAPYADPHFVDQIRRDFDSRFWEMYLTCTLLEHGFNLQCPKPGPDILVEHQDKKIWIEAVAPTPGDPSNPNAVKEPPLRVATRVPHDPIIIRYRSVIEQKFKDYKKYLGQGVIDASDSYLIAINGRKIPHHWGEEEIPRILKAVFPIGALEAIWDTQSGTVVETRHQFKPDVSKASGTKVSTTIFLDPDYEALSGVWFSSVDAANRPDQFGQDFVLVHNPLARNSVPRELFKMGREYIAIPTNGEYQLECKDWR